MTDNIYLYLELLLIILKTKIARLSLAIIILTFAIYYFETEIKNAQQSTLFKLTCSFVCSTLIILSGYYIGNYGL